MNENSTLDEATLARQALQESMDLRDQGHTNDCDQGPTPCVGLTHGSPDPRGRPSRPSTGWDGRPHPDTAP